MFRALFYSASLLLFISCKKDKDSEPEVEIKNGIGASRTERLYDATVNLRGGIIAVGESNSPEIDPLAGDAEQRSWVISTDVTGKLLWQKKLRGEQSSYATRIITAGTDGYVILSNHDGPQHSMITKMDHDGKVILQKYAGLTAKMSSWWDVTATSDGGFILAGSAARGEEGYIEKLNSNFDRVWLKTFSGAMAKDMNAVAATPDGGCIVAGMSEGVSADITGTPNGASDGWIVRVDAAGKTVWQKLVGDATPNSFLSVVPGNNGGFVASGIFNGQLWVYAFDDSGTKKWEVKNADVDPYSWAVIKQASGNSYIVAATTKPSTTSPSSQSQDGYAFRIGTDGTVLTTKIAGSPYQDAAICVLETFPGDFVFIGYTKAKTGGIEHLNGWVQNFKF